MRTLALLVLGLPLVGCLSVTYGRTNRDEPLALARAQELVPGRTGLAECLAAFGAPRWVFEQPAARGDGAVLAWGWLDEADLGLSLSLPVSDRSSLNLDYRTIDARTRGLVLFFDGDWVLTDWRSGLVLELTRDVRTRPTIPEEDA